MTQEELRLECLRLARPDNVADPDAERIVARATVFLKFAMGEPKRLGRPPKADKPQGPAPTA